MYRSSPEALIFRPCINSNIRTRCSCDRAGHEMPVYRGRVMPGIIPVRLQAGFTLVEIAMTLAVIGLLIGSVIKGQELITNVRLKKMEKDSIDISMAIFAYQDRYGPFPGDDNKVTSRFSVYADGINDPAANDINGNGDGLIDGNWIGDANSETANLWKHLRAAGLISGNGDDDRPPKNAYNGNIGVRDDSLKITGHVIVFGLIEGRVAAIVDSRHDNNNPSSGYIQSDLSAQLMDGSASSTAGTSYSESSRYFMSIKM